MAKKKRAIINLGLVAFLAVGALVVAYIYFIDGGKGL